MENRGTNWMQISACSDTLSMAWKMNYQASQWFIPLAPHKTLLCNCLLGKPPKGRGFTNLHSLITKVGGLVNPGDTRGCSRRLTSGLGSASCFFSLGTFTQLSWTF